MYLELFLLDNFLMNFLILKAAEAMLSRSAPRFAIPICACAMAVYAAVAAGYAPILLHPAAKLACSGLMALFLCRQPRLDYPAAVAALFASTFLLGGLAYALSGCVSFGSASFSLPLRSVLLAVVCALPLPRCIRLWRRRQAHARQATLLRITHRGQSHVLRAMVDSGNTLCDPLSGLPIIVVESRFMPEDVPLRPIPCSTVSGSCMLYACKPDRIQARAGGWLDLKALVAASPNELKGVDALVGSQVF